MDRELEQWKAREVARLLALVETERRYYQEIVAALPVGLLVLSSDLSIVSSNREIRKIFGLRAGEPLRGRLDTFVPQSLVEIAREVIGSGEPRNNLTVHVPGESGRTLRVNIRQIQNWDDDPQHEALLTVEDNFDPSSNGNTRRARDEESIPASELLDNLDGLVWAVELPSKRFLYVNDKAEEMLGYAAEKWLSSPSFWSDRVHPDDRDWVLESYDRSIENWSRHSCEYRAVSSYGKVVWLRETARLLQDADGRTRHLLGFGMEITQRHLLERQYVQAQRMEALGTLSARLSTEIANHVTVVESSIDKGDRNKVVAATARLRTLADRLSSFNHYEALPSEALDLTELLQAIAPEIQKAVGGSIEFELTLFPAIVGVRTNPVQLQEILTTLVQRAVRDMRGKGKLTVECSPAEIDEVLQRPEAMLPAGVYAVITVEDNGATMDAKSRAGVFESFLPAQNSVDDLGPKLARVYSLVRQWGGDLLISTSVPQGNVFQVFLPRVGERIEVPVQELPTPAPAVAPPPTPAPDTAPPTADRPQTILVLEADHGIRALVQKMLKRQSYTVLEASDAASLPQRFEEHAGAVDLLIADVPTGDDTAHQTIEGLRKCRPKLKVLFLSEHAGVNEASLQKPFTLGSLIGKVKEILADPRPL